MPQNQREGKEATGGEEQGSLVARQVSAPSRATGRGSRRRCAICAVGRACSNGARARAGRGRPGRLA